MAEIQKRIETVTKTFYRLDLSEDEAQVLADMLSVVGGDPFTSRRRYAKSVLEALQSAGLTWNSERDYAGTGWEFQS